MIDIPEYLLPINYNDSACRRMSEGFTERALASFSKVLTVGLARLFSSRYIKWRETPASKASCSWLKCHSLRNATRASPTFMVVL